MLGDVDHEALRDAFAVLLSPLDAVDATIWRGEVGRVLCELTGADNAVFELHTADLPVLYSEDYPQVVLDAYLERYGALDIGRKRRGEPGLEVWNLALLYGDQLGEFEKSEFYRDFLVPNRILDSMGMTVVVSRSTALATLFLHSEQAGRPASSAGRLHQGDSRRVQHQPAHRATAHRATAHREDLRQARREVTRPGRPPASW